MFIVIQNIDKSGNSVSKTLVGLSRGSRLDALNSHKKKTRYADINHMPMETCFSLQTYYKYTLAKNTAFSIYIGGQTVGLKVEEPKQIHTHLRTEKSTSSGSKTSR